MKKYVSLSLLVFLLAAAPLLASKFLPSNNSCVVLYSGDGNVNGKLVALHSQNHSSGMSGCPKFTIYPATTDLLYVKFECADERTVNEYDKPVFHYIANFYSRDLTAKGYTRTDASNFVMFKASAGRWMEGKVLYKLSSSCGEDNSRRNLIVYSLCSTFVLVAFIWLMRYKKD